MHSHLDFDFCFCFRCLNRDSGWVSKARLSKNDDSHSWYTLNHVEQASRSLGMDIVVYTEDVIPIKNDKAAQKRLLGAEFWSFLQNTLPNEDLNLLFSTLHDWLVQQKWIEDRVDKGV